MVKRLLEFVAFGVEHVFISIRGHVDRWSNIHARACKRFRNLKPIPTRRGPITGQRHRDGQDRVTRLFREHHGSHLCHVARTLWTIDRKRCRATGAHQPRHLDNRRDASTSTRSTNGSVSKSLNEPRNVLTVEAARRHDDDATFAPPVSRQKNAIVPEDVYRQSTVLFCFFVIFPAYDFEAGS